MEEKNAAAGDAPEAKASRKAIAGYSAFVFVLYMGFRMYALTKHIVGRASLVNIFMFSSWVLHRGAAYHGLDYSMGFLPHALSGQILTFFAGETITDRAAALYLLLAFVLTYGLFSVIVGILLEKAVRTENYLMALFPFLFILAPLTVWARTFFFMNYDTFMLLIALPAFLILLWRKNEWLLWLIPVLSCLGIMTNHAFVLLFFPLLFALQYYEYIKSGLKKSRLLQMIVTTVSSALLAAYMVLAPAYSGLLQKYGLYKYSHAQAIAMLEAKIGRTLDVHEILYTSFSVFGMRPAAEVYDLDAYYSTYAGEFSPWNPQTEEFISTFLPQYFFLHLYAFLILAPIVVFAFAVWRKMAKGETGFLSKSPYYLFMLAPFIIVPAFVVFVDMDRLVWSALLTQLLFVIYVYFKNERDVAFERLKQITKNDKTAILCAALFGLAIFLPVLLFKGADWLNPLTLETIAELLDKVGIILP